MNRKNTLRGIAAAAAGILVIALGDAFLDPFAVRILNLSAIYIILALSLNLLNGFTGLFSLGHAGFMAVGAYVSALLTMTPAQKSMNFFLTPIVPWLETVQVPFLAALILAGLGAAFVGLLIGAPALRLRDDYLAIATLGFAEIIRVLITNAQSVTNGAQGLKAIPRYSTTWVVWGCAAITALFLVMLLRSSYGRTIKAVRDDEIAAEAMGVNVFRVKVTSFVISSFWAGIGGALLGHMITTIDPKMFNLILTFNILLIVVLGGNGSLTGSVLGAIIVTVLMEALRFLDMPMNLIFIKTQGLPGLRMVIFSILLMVVVLYRQRGLMGSREFSWDMFSARSLLAALRSGKRGENARKGGR
jgi:branched-chain amino acid transport system permease protein